MRLTLIIVALLIAITWGAYHVYRDPRVQDLFRQPEPKTIAVPPPEPVQAAPVPDIPTPPRKPSDIQAGIVGATPASRQTRAAARPPEEETKEAPVAQNKVANDVVTRVLLQVLAAKNLVYGVSIRVTDKSITVDGVVNSEEKRKQILDIIEKGRETRRIDASHLVVRQ